MKLLLFNQGTRGHDGVHESVVLQENYIQGIKISFCFPVLMRYWFSGKINGCHPFAPGSTPG